MHRERVSENVFWFQSEVYAQVTAGVVAGPQWAVVIDTLALPEETLSMREFIEHELGEDGMRRSVLVVATSDRPSSQAWIAAASPGSRAPT